MKKQENRIQFQMQLSKINVLKFAQYDVEEFDVTKEDAIEFESEFNIKVLEESSEIVIEMVLKLKVVELEKYFGELKISTTFHIIPFETVIKTEKDGHQIPDSLVANLFNIVAGTARGILFEKLRGTILQNEVLPLIDVNEMLGLKNKN